ncbi:MAG: hypothetical protein JWM74_1756, partial [Myxococcaceae bacterium]|nr:hypothetical protein [Myxococcaceae bacterium]
HRVAVALAYAAWHRAANPAQGASAVVEAAAGPVWSPGSFTDEALLAFVGKRTMLRAQAMVKEGVTVEVEPGEIPAARLPTCSVRFLVPRDMTYARCDCQMATACEHVVVAAWAFRQAGDALAAPRTLEVESKSPRATARVAADAKPIEAALDLASNVLLEGVAHLPPEIAQQFARVRIALTAASFAWPAAIVDDLEQSLEAYRARSARYSSASVVQHLTELAARARASAAGAAGRCELPAGVILGTEEAPETRLDHVRLVSLGARLEADGTSREAEVYLADPDSGVVLVLAKRWTFAEGEESPDGAALGERAIATRIGLGTLARGQMVSRGVKRQANRAMALAGPRPGQTSITPQSGDWSLFPREILVSDFDELDRALRALPPRFLRPRVLAASMRVVSLAGGAVGRIMYQPGAQELVAELRDADGNQMLLRRKYRRVAPNALEAIARALAGGGVRFVSGDVRRGDLGLEIDPTAIVTDRVIVPDIEAAKGALAEHVVPYASTTAPLSAALSLASSLLEEVPHHGALRLRQEWSERAAHAVAALEGAGLQAVGKRVSDVARALRGVRPENARAAADVWFTAAIRVALTQEALGAS